LITLGIILALALLISTSTRPKPIEVAVKPVETGDMEQTVANTRAGTVKAGTLLLELWNKDLRAEIALNESESKATLANARAAYFQADVIEREAKRKTRLKVAGAVSEESVDMEETEAQARRADCESANAMAKVSSARVDVAKSQLSYAPKILLQLHLLPLTSQT